MRKNLLLLLLLSIAHLVSAQELWLQNNETPVPDHLSLKEIKSITHTLEDGNAVVNIYKHNGADYTFKADDVSALNTVSPWNAVLDDDRYQNMKEIRDIRNFRDYEDGDLVAITSEDDYSNEEFISKAYNVVAFIDTTMQRLMNLNITELAVQYSVKKSNIRIHRTAFIYVSSDVDGEKILLSGNIFYPYIDGKKTFKCKYMYLDNHMTLFNDPCAPSFGAFGMGPLLQGVVTRGYCVVQPDLIGFGPSVTRTQQYVDINANPKHAVDCLLATMQYKELSADEGYITLNFENKAKLINTGGSQGATASIGVTYYLENVMDPDKKALLPELLETRLCAGAFNMKLTLDEYCKTNRVIFSPIVPLMVQGLFANHYKEIVDENGNPYSIHDYFNPEIRTRKWNVAPYAEGEYTLWQMMDLKVLPSAPFLEYFVDVCGVVDPTIPMYGSYAETDRILSKDLLAKQADGTYKLNEESQKAKVLVKILESNIMTDSSRWVPKSNIKLLHGTDDFMVPYANSTELYDNMHELMEANGHTFEFTTLENTNALGNHVAVCAVWAISEVSGLSVELILKMMNPAEQPV